MQNYIPKDQRKKILLMCDDIRFTSGIATMAREIVVGTSHHFNWVNIGGAINHPEKGTRLDLSSDTNKNAGIEDSYIMVYPTDGYGTIEFVRQIIDVEKPDAIMLFTDPRYWIWLFQHERELRQQLPIIYLNIWDDLPYPLYNKPYYESCDTLFAISKQTENINRVVLGDVAKDKLIKYVPHGINEKQYYPLDKSTDDFKSFKKQIFGESEYDFIAFHNARNLRRKSTSDLILAFKTFLDKLPKQQADKCALIMHTDAVDDNGTDLPKVIEMLMGDKQQNIFISNQKINTEQLNKYYNLADITALISSNEGWGLSLTESMMAGTPILANVTGGMQDQMRFEDADGNWIKFTEQFGSNHLGKYKKHGKFAFPVFPSNVSLIGSPPTPYIFDDRCDFRDVANQLASAYALKMEDDNEYAKLGEAAREWVTSDESMMTAANMCINVIDGIDKTFKTWTPRPVFDLIKIEDYKPNYLKYPVAEHE
jgi:glycosyltransferase involved in cell wall biosynthesis